MNQQGKNGIEYLDFTWNPITGCKYFCSYCFLIPFTRRFGSNKISDTTADIMELNERVYKQDKNGKMVCDPFPYGMKPTYHKYRLNEPKTRRKPSVIGVVFAGDMFGEWVPQHWIFEIFDRCYEASWHKYVFITKNPKKMNDTITAWLLERNLYIHSSHRTEKLVLPNWWFGTTVTRQADLNRIEKLPEVGNRYVSFEPLHEDIKLSYGFSASYLDTVDWVIIGEETGKRAKTVDPHWAASILVEADHCNVPAFVKNPLSERNEGFKDLKHYGNGLRETPVLKYA